MALSLSPWDVQHYLQVKNTKHTTESGDLLFLFDGITGVCMDCIVDLIIEKADCRL